MASRFDDAFERLIGVEGGYVNDPDDPGGETKYGISKRSYPREDIRGLTLERAKEIYRRDFWERSGSDRVNDGRIAYRLFDLSVNCGLGAAGKCLQRAVNTLGGDLVVDGQVGPVTIRAVNGYRHPVALYEAFKYHAIDRYIKLGNPKYLAGWLNRIGL